MAKKKNKKRKVRKVKKAKGKKVKRSKAKKRRGANVVYLGLGSNVGDREEYIEQAIFLLEKSSKVEVLKHASNYETEPEGGGPQSPFINTVVALKTKLSPHQLFEFCEEIEAALGRERELKWGPRTIDIDILLFNDDIFSDEKLQIPHPLMHERLFVLRPLREIAPHLMHPVLEKSIENLYEERKTELGDKYDDELPGFKEIKSATSDDYERW